MRLYKEIKNIFYSLDDMPLPVVPCHMVATAKLIEKLSNQTIKKQELATLLQRLGFIYLHGCGSHEVWGNKAYSDIHIVIATHSKDVPFYQLRQIEKSLKKRGFL